MPGRLLLQAHQESLASNIASEIKRREQVTNGNIKMKKGLHFTLSEVPRAIAPIFFLPRYNAVVGSFNREQFAVLSAFQPNLDLKTNLERQSLLVDYVKEADYGWFPLHWNWLGEIRRSLFVHRQGFEAAELKRKQNPGDGELHMPEPTMELVLSLRKKAGFDRFILGGKGSFLVYEGDPPLPIGTGDKLWICPDLDFISFREGQGKLVTQHPKAL